MFEAGAGTGSITMRVEHPQMDLKDAKKVWARVRVQLGCRDGFGSSRAIYAENWQGNVSVTEGG